MSMKASWEHKRMPNPKMTVRQLRERLQSYAGTPADNLEIVCWLPGSRINLHQVFTFASIGVVAIEGNVEPGSALDVVAEPSKPIMRCDNCDNGVELEWEFCAWCGGTKNWIAEPSP